MSAFPSRASDFGADRVGQAAPTSPKNSASPKTVSVYLGPGVEKLALTNNAEMTVYAIRNGLV